MSTNSQSEIYWKNIRRKGTAFTAQANVSQRPTLISKFGARKRRNTRQSRNDTVPSIIVIFVVERKKERKKERAEKVEVVKICEVETRPNQNAKQLILRRQPQDFTQQPLQQSVKSINQSNGHEIEKITHPNHTNSGDTWVTVDDPLNMAASTTVTAAQAELIRYVFYSPYETSSRHHTKLDL